MKTKIIILASLIIIACNSSKEVLKNEEIKNKNYFRVNGVYSQLSENNYCNLYFFNSEDSTVYFSKLKIDDTAKITNKPKLKIAVFGDYKIESNIMKIKQYKEKGTRVQLSAQDLLKSIVFTFPFPIPRAPKTEIVISDQIITEGEIKEDTILLNKMYIGNKRLSFKKKKSSKTHALNLILIYEPKLKGIIKREPYYNYEVQIVSE